MVKRFSRFLAPATAAILILGVWLGARADAETAQIEPANPNDRLATILSSGETVIGQPIAYPAGKRAQVTAMLITIPPGRDTGWHSHPVPLFAYVLEGELTVDYAEKGVKTYHAGEGMLEAMNWPHEGRNTTEQPVKILAVYMGAEGVPNSEPFPVMTAPLVK